jgi:hypothetical protein
VNTGGPWWIWFLPFVFGLPWIVAIAWFWKRTPRRGEEPPSLAEMTRRRLWS